MRHLNTLGDVIGPFGCLAITLVYMIFAVIFLMGLDR